MRQLDSKLSGLLMQKLLNRKTMFSNSIQHAIGKASLLGLCMLLFTGLNAQTDNALGFSQGDYVLVDNPADFNVGASTDFTIQAVIKSYYAGGTLHSLFTKVVEPNNPNQAITGYQLSTVNGKLAFEWFYNGNSYLKIESTVHADDGQCHHVAVVVDRSGTNAKLYIDGVLDKDVTDARYAQNIDNIAPVYIGAHQLLHPQNTWYGTMDEVAFFTSARTASEIASDAQLALAGTEPNLVGYWKFDSGVVGADNTGVTTAIDQTGRNNGTLLNFDLTGTQVITNVPNGPVVVGTWVASECPLTPGGDPPVIDPLSDIVLQDCDGTIVTYDFSSAVTSTTPVTITYNPASGSAFNLGSTQVTMTATNADGSDTETFNVIIEDNVNPTVDLLGDNPLILCQGEQFVDPLALPDDNCGLSDFQPSGTVDVNTPGNYTVTYTVTDVGGNTASVARTVTVKPTPAQLEQENCSNNNPTCGLIFLRPCQYDQYPDFEAAALANTNYAAGASLNWYANGPIPGAPLPGPPTANTDNPSSNTFAWVTQTVDGCESDPIKMRTKIKPSKDPGLTLDFSGFTLPTCGGGNNNNFANAVSGAHKKVNAFNFYKGKPNAGGTFLGTVAATNGVPNTYLYLPFSNGTHDYYVQSVRRDGKCGGEASDQVILNSSIPVTSVDVTINGGPTVNYPSYPTNLTVTQGDQFIIRWNGPITGAIFFHLPVQVTRNTFVRNVSWELAMTVPTNAPASIPLRLVAYSGNCATTYHSTLTVTPCVGCRTEGEEKTNLSLSAHQLNANDVKLDWELDYDMAFEVMEVQKEIAPDEFETIHVRDFAGNGVYSFIDRDGISELSRYRVLIQHKDGYGFMSDEVEVRTSNALANQKAFAVYPNPAHDHIQVRARFPMEETFNWQLTDMVGKTMMTGTMQAEEMSLDLSRLAEGMYQLVTISPQGVRSVNRIVKQ